MSNKIYRHLIDGIVLLILLSCAVIIFIAIYDFFVPSYPEQFAYMKFSQRLQMLMLTIFGVTSAAGVASSIILVATRRLRQPNND